MDEFAERPAAPTPRLPKPEVPRDLWAYLGDRLESAGAWRGFRREGGMTGTPAEWPRSGGTPTAWLREVLSAYWSARPMEQAAALSYYTLLSLATTYRRCRIIGLTTSSGLPTARAQRLGSADCRSRGGQSPPAYTPMPWFVSGTKTWFVVGSTATECASFVVGMFSTHRWVTASMTPNTGPPGFAPAAR